MKYTISEEQGHKTSKASSTRMKLIHIGSEHGKLLYGTNDRKIKSTLLTLERNP